MPERQKAEVSKMSIKSYTVMLLVLLSFARPSTVLASSDSSRQQTQDAERQWMQLQNTSPGVELIVESTGKSSLRGRFVSASDTKLTMFVEQKNFEIDRSSIRRIYAVRDRSRSRSTLIGAGVGLAAGIGIGFLVIAGSDNSDANFAPLSLGVLGTLAGAAIGALTGGKRQGRLLYSSK
jgi:hypothetical protein